MGLRIDRGAGTQRTRRARATRDAGRALATLTPVSTDGSAVPTLASASDTADALAQAFRRTGKLVAKLRGRGTSPPAGDSVAEADAPPAAPAPVQAPSPAEQGRQFGLTAGIQGTAAVLLDDPTPEAEMFNEAAVDGFASGAKVRLDRTIADVAAAHPADPEAFEATARQALAREVEQVDPQFGLVLEILYETRIERARSELESARQTQEQELLVTTLQQSYRDDFEMARRAARTADFDEMDSRSTQAGAALQQLQELGVMSEDEAAQRIDSLRVITRNETVSDLFEDALQDGESAVQTFIEDFSSTPQEGFTPEEQQEFVELLTKRVNDHRQAVAIGALRQEEERQRTQATVALALRRRAREGDVHVREDVHNLRLAGQVDDVVASDVTTELESSLSTQKTEAELKQEARNRYQNLPHLFMADPRDQRAADIVYESDIRPQALLLREQDRMEDAVDLVVQEIARTGIMFSDVAAGLHNRFDELPNVEDLEYAVRLHRAIERLPYGQFLLRKVPEENRDVLARVDLFQSAGVGDVREAVEEVHRTLSPIGAEQRAVYAEQYDARRERFEEGNHEYINNRPDPPWLIDVIATMLGGEPLPIVREMNRRMDVLVEHYYPFTGGNIGLAREISARNLEAVYGESVVGIPPDFDFWSGRSRVRERPPEWEAQASWLSPYAVGSIMNEDVVEKVQGHLTENGRAQDAQIVQISMIELRYIQRSEHWPENNGLPAYEVFVYLRNKDGSVPKVGKDFDLRELQEEGEKLDLTWQPPVQKVIDARDETSTLTPTLSAE